MRNFLPIFLFLFLFACVKGEVSDDIGKDRKQLEREELGSFFGGEIDLFGNNSADSGNGLNVNAYLWRGSLDVISFFPLSSADPFGGLILTDWYSPPKEKDNRYKVTIYIFGRELRADGLRVNVFKEKRNNAASAWETVETPEKMAVKLEDAILSRARELRVKARNLGDQ